MESLLRTLQALNLPSSLLLLVTFGFSAYAFSRMMAETYDKVAHILGPLGRHWAAKKQQRLDHVESLYSLRDELRAVTKQYETCQTRSESQLREITFLRDMRDNDKWNQALRMQVDRLSATVTGLLRRLDVTDAYLGYVTEWHRKADIAWQLGDRQTIEREVPPFMSYIVFEREYEATKRAAMDQLGSPSAHIVEETDQRAPGAHRRPEE